MDDQPVEDFVYGEELIGRQAWLNDRCVEVVSLSSPPSYGSVSIAHAVTRLSLGNAPVSSLTYTQRSSHFADDAVIATPINKLIGRELFWGGTKVTVTGAHYPPVNGSVRVRYVDGLPHEEEEEVVNIDRLMKFDFKTVSASIHLKINDMIGELQILSNQLKRLQ